MSTLAVLLIVAVAGVAAMGMWVYNLYRRIEKGQRVVDELEGNPTHDKTKRKNTI